jgi:hypothetical protein
VRIDDDAMLQLSTFNQEFMVEYDASGSRFDAILHQGKLIGLV